MPNKVCYELITGFERELVNDIDVQSIISRFKIKDTPENKCIVAMHLAKHYGADGCRVYYLAADAKEDTEDPLGRIYVGSYNVPGETFLWDLV